MKTDFNRKSIIYVIKYLDTNLTIENYIRPSILTFNGIQFSLHRFFSFPLRIPIQIVIINIINV